MMTFNLIAARLRNQKRLDDNNERYTDCFCDLCNTQTFFFNYILLIDEFYILYVRIKSHTVQQKIILLKSKKKKLLFPNFIKMLNNFISWILFYQTV